MLQATRLPQRPQRSPPARAASAPRQWPSSEGTCRPIYATRCEMPPLQPRADRGELGPKPSLEAWLRSNFDRDQASRLRPGRILTETQASRLGSMSNFGWDQSWRIGSMSNFDPDQSSRIGSVSNFDRSQSSRIGSVSNFDQDQSSRIDRHEILTQTIPRGLVLAEIRPWPNLSDSIGAVGRRAAPSRATLLR